MKVAPKVIFLLSDSEGFVATIADALHSNPNSSLRRTQESFELSLERYGIKEQKARGNLVHFVDDKGNYQVSVLLLQNYEPPTLVCAINEVLAQITCETSTAPALLVPFIVEPSKFKGQDKMLAMSGNRIYLYGFQIGLEEDTTPALAATTQKLPSSWQIHYEPLACFLQLVRILKFPTFILVGLSRSHSGKTLGCELEILYEIGELLASETGLFFLREKITWNPTKASRNTQEPWRALYG
ncbi:Period circadian protein [Melia azedarach]|uniref:Period circadian protein n=1 Tax=Melia azedarach TaxID=155640 RepID=A0ACC1Z3B9_MELAZ|nr:Period circadian protein [Melia azedarach]